MNNLAIIPARSGSKGLKDKNIKLLNGKPLIAYSIEAAKKSEIYSHILVSTDSERYGEIAIQYGAEVPFYRSEENASDVASSWDVVKEVLKKYQEMGIVFDTFTLLQPTSPLRKYEDIKKAYELFKEKDAIALSRQGIQIISGMARGIDRDAHMGCLEAGGNTYAVLGSGADTCYPKENRFLYDKIKVFGGIISELMPGTDPQKMFFPMRNRIISGLSDIVVIVEAKKRSGSLITADFAMEQGKDVYVIPGRITDTLSYGCNSLIKQGAGIIYNIDEFVSDITMTGFTECTQMDFRKNLLDKKEALVYSLLDFCPIAIGTLSQKVPYELSELFEVLENLIQKGFVKETIPNYYIRSL